MMLVVPANFVLSFAWLFGAGDFQIAFLFLSPLISRVSSGAAARKASAACLCVSARRQAVFIYAKRSLIKQMRRLPAAGRLGMRPQGLPAAGR